MSECIVEKWIDDPLFRIRHITASGNMVDLLMSQKEGDYEFVGRFHDQRYAMLLMKALTEESLFGENDGVAG